MYYYRVVSDYLGEEIEFKPEHSYESIDYVNGELIEVDYKIKEVCFSKKIESCFFAISMFLKEGRDYYIYRTHHKPDIDLSMCSIGDFKANKEVRFRKPIRAFYIGKFNVHENFYNAIINLYHNCDFGNYFDNDTAVKMLDKYYWGIYSEIEYQSKELEEEYDKRQVI